MVLATLAALVGALVGFVVRRRTAALRAARDAHTAPWEALVLSRTDLHLSVDEHGVATLHGIARGVRYSVTCERASGSRAHLKVTARRLLAGGLQLWVGPRSEGASTSGDVLTDRSAFGHALATGDASFDARMMVWADRDADPGALLSEAVRAGLELFPDPVVVLDAAWLTMKLSYLSEGDLDDVRVDALRSLVSTLCGAPDATPGASP